MAQETLDLDLPSGDLSTPSDPSSLSRNSSFSRLNAQAPEFVPRAPPRPDLPPPRLAMAPAHGVVPVYPGPSSPFHVPIQNHHQHQQHHHHHVQYHQYHQYYGGGFGDHPEGVGQAHQASADSDHVAASRNGLSEEVTQKILNQVEYYFSDVNLATTEHLMRFINKDPEGYASSITIGGRQAFVEEKRSTNSSRVNNRTRFSNGREFFPEGTRADFESSRGILTEIELPL